MTAEWVLGIVSSVAAVISVIFGGNLFTRHINHAKELAVTQYKLDETQKKLNEVAADVAALKSTSVEVNTKIAQFEEHVKKLEMIPSLDAKLTAMTDLVRGLQSIVISLKRHED